MTTPFTQFTLKDLLREEAKQFQSNNNLNELEYAAASTLADMLNRADYERRERAKHEYASRKRKIAKRK